MELTLLGIINDPVNPRQPENADVEMVVNCSGSVNVPVKSLHL